MEIPKHVVIWNIRPGMAFVAPIHAWEFDRITDEKDGKVIEDEVLVALLREELGCPASYIAYCVARSFLSRNSRDSAEDFGLSSDSIEEFGVGEIAIIMSYLELTPGTGCFGMYASVHNQTMSHASRTRSNSGHCIHKDRRNGTRA